MRRIFGAKIRCIVHSSQKDLVEFVVGYYTMYYSDKISRYDSSLRAPYIVCNHGNTGCCVDAFGIIYVLYF